MADIKISCPQCSQHIQCDEGYGGHQINCPHCQQTFIVPQIVRAEPLPLPTATPVPPPAARLGIKRPQRPDYVGEAQAWESEEANTPSASRRFDEVAAESNPTAAACMILGVICYAFGLVDFAGMFFHYDITGVFWSPIVAGLIGSVLVGSGYKMNKGREAISDGASTITLILVGVVTAGAIYYFSTGSRLLTSTSSLESQVKASIQTKLAQDPETSSTQIKSFHLVHESGNKYKGMLEAQTEGNTETVEVEVTFDGRNIIWKIQPQGPQMPIDPATGLPLAPTDSTGKVENFQPAAITIKDGVVTIEKLKSMAEQGDTDAQFQLAFEYVKGDLLPKDVKAGFFWYQKAADNGHSEAQGQLGLLYEHGVGVARNYSEALKWYRNAASKGDALAQCRLGDMYVTGTGVPKSITEGVKWYRQSAAQGQPLAELGLGCLYADGIGVPRNNEEAYFWVSLAAAQDVENAHETLDTIAARMTPNQIAKAQERAASFTPKKEGRR